MKAVVRGLIIVMLTTTTLALASSDQQQLVDQARCLLFVQVEFELGILLAEGADCRWQDEGRDGRDRAEMKGAREQSAGALNRLDQGMGIIDQRIGARHRQLSGMSQLGAARFAFGQFDAQQILQFLDPG